MGRIAFQATLFKAPDKRAYPVLSKKRFIIKHHQWHAPMML